ncbi:HAD family phosphatase [Streptomyces sp. VRA16 Mangrove soil]|uniref:HAD family hydrolase n=1 Tax=Streptomyces sp. VRA16 Mangrove soil TaxID=2817434 RepID=UPI001A9FA339|nr:HAD family phosphatase [Streptomyces sp. VRA16 Mangrove soil]MBO1331357.1 HAD family phosphatase [Streptomyces sp. VRA16 Mangrove soil]
MLVRDKLSPDGAACLLFDWDGTLVDSQAANYRAMAQTLAVEGVELEQDWFDSRTGLSSADMITALAAERSLRLTRTVPELVAKRDELFLSVAHTVRPHARVQAVVEQAAGRIPVAVASGSTRAMIDAALRHQPFSETFDLIVTRDDVERGKPAPDIFLTAARRLGVQPRACLVYEDSDEGIAAAEAAGMRVIDVRPYR